MARTAVHIFLDTNALFTEVANRLVAKEISDFILQSLDNDLSPSWYIPSIVIGERRFQMFERAKRLLPHLEKVEQLLGHQLGITEKVLSARVDDAIKQHIDTHKLIEIGFDHLAVDWQDMVRKSVERKPPFKQGDNEKGFRDAIVLETFCQWVSNLPRSPQSCRIVLLSNDGLLLEAARERMGDRNNVTFASGLDDVRTMLNALASQIDQATVNVLLPKAFKLFFESENPKTLYYAAGVQNKILTVYGNQLNEVPNGWSHVTMQSIVLSLPTFIEKKGQKLTFSNKVVYGVRAVRYVQRTTADYVTGQMFPGSTNPAAIRNILFGPGSSTSGIMSSSDIVTAGQPFTGTSISTSTSAGSLPGTSSFSPPTNMEEVRREGEIVFEITWTATLTAKGKLTSAQLQKIDYKETNWKGS